MRFSSSVLVAAIAGAASSAVQAFLPAYPLQTKLASVQHGATKTSLGQSSTDVDSLKQAMLRNPSQSKDIMLYQMYEDWREEHGKGEFETNRFMEFKSNYMLMQQNYERAVAIAKTERRDPPPPPELNEYADLTEAEYHRMLKFEEEGDEEVDQDEMDQPTSSVAKSTATQNEPAYWEDEVKEEVAPKSAKKKVVPRTSIEPPVERASTKASAVEKSPTKKKPFQVKPETMTSSASPRRRDSATNSATESLKQAMLRNPSQSKEIVIFQMYEDWRKQYNKGEFDTNRFMEFKSNYMMMQQNYERAVALAKMDRRAPPPRPEINEYADLTKAEYLRILQATEEPEEPSAEAEKIIDEEPMKVSKPTPQRKVVPRTSLEPPKKTLDVAHEEQAAKAPRATPPPPRRTTTAESAPTSDDLKQAMLRNPSQSKDIMIYQMYEDWRKKHNKGEFDTNRFMEFKSNYMLMQRNHERAVALAKMERRPPPPPPEINEYADLTEAEYHRQLKGKDDKVEHDEEFAEAKQKQKLKSTVNEAPQVIVWGPEVDASSAKKSDGIRGSSIGRTKHARKTMPPIRVNAQGRDKVPLESGSVASERQGRHKPPVATRRSSETSPPTIRTPNVRPNWQDIRKQPARSSFFFTGARSAISKGSSPISVDNRGPDAKSMPVDFPERKPPASRGVSRTPGVSDQETRIPRKTVDPSSSYAAHNKVDLKKMSDVPGVSDQETKLPPARVSTEYYTQAPKKRVEESAVADQGVATSSVKTKQQVKKRISRGAGVSSDQDTKDVPRRVSTDFYTQAPKKEGVRFPSPGVSDQEVRAPSDNVDPSGSYAAENKKDLKRMAVVPHKGSSGSLSRDRIDPSASYPREMRQNQAVVSDQESRAPADVVDTDSYSQARGRPSRFTADQGTPKTFTKPAFRVSPEALSGDEKQVDEEDSPASSEKPKISADQNSKAPADRINPDSIHAGHWPL